MSTDVALGGLYDGHEGYRTPTDEELGAVLTLGIVAVDTNILLDLYCYGEQARTEFVRVLFRVRDNLFVPAQVRTEFWRNRDSVLEDVASAQAKTHLGEVRSSLRKTVDAWAARTQALEQASGFLTEAAALFDRLEVTMRETTGRLDSIAALRDTSCDPVLTALNEVLCDRVGPQVDSARLAELIEGGRQRLADDVPPGYLDAAKVGVESGTGDYLIWEELLERAKATGLDVLFVTRDEKPDWWRKDRRHGFLGPRVELVAEMRERAGTAFFMVRPPELLRIATNLLNVEVSDRTIEDASRVAVTASAVDDWATESVVLLLERLEANGAWVQADVIRESASSQDGFVSRSRVYQIGGYDEARQLKGFTRPVVSAVAELVGRGDVPENVAMPLAAVYSKPGKADGFTVHRSIVAALADDEDSSQHD